MPFLTAAYGLLALRLQEDASALSSGDVTKHLQGAVTDHFRGSGNWGYYQDHFGDDDSGDVIYSSGGETYKAPYEISGTPPAASIDHEKRTKVIPRTVYDEQEDEGDHYAKMQESALYTPGPLPLCERLVSKSERDSMDESDFAGKGKSFPINKPEDVMAAVRSIGRAGSGNLGPSGIKARIIGIAKRKGWTKYLPKSWQEGGAKATESAKSSPVGKIKIVESFPWAESLLLSESIAGGIERDVRIIVPCTGSTAHYTSEALKKSAGAFAAGTQMFINHPTKQEERERPERDWRELVGQLTQPARWEESHKGGPGLYAKAKFVSKLAPEVIEKASMSGVSIRANGDALMESGKPVVKNGQPVLERITSVESIDIVTKAGAGGLILSESARTDPQTSEVNMTDEQVKLLISEAVKAATSPLRERALRGDALYAGHQTLAGVAFTDEQKSFVIEEAIRAGLPEKDGALDTEKFGVLVMAEARRLGKVISNGGKVRGLGVAVAEAKDGMKECPHCDGDGEDGDGEDCEHCDGTGKIEAGKKKTKESRNPEKELATTLSSALGLSESAAKRAAEGRD